MKPMNNFALAQLALIAAVCASLSNDCAAQSSVANPHHATPHQHGLAAAEEALKSFKVADGLEISLFAAEPMLRNPTDMDIDERGRVWITEGVNYRSTFQPWGVLQPAGDRIVILEDTNGDGLADKATTFYQGPEINAALGICVLGNKVIVCCSPNVYVFTDTNGDGIADKKEILFSGIGGVDHDHGVHAFTFGPDGKLYFNFGNESKQLKDKDGHPIIDLAGNVVGQGHPYRQGMTFRCNLDGSEVEVLADNFRNPYEVAVDSFGTLWQSDNDDDGNRATRVNYVMPYGNYGYVDEMTGAGWYEKRSNMEKDIPHQHWHQNDPGVVPNLLLTGAGAPTGIVIYEGKLLPEIFRNQILLADAGTRVVRGFPVQADGAGYAAHAVDLLSSSDTWFRPSDICVAPDGSLYVADWNDAGVGGHGMADRDPATMTGRIYRIAPPGVKPFVPKLNLVTAAGCVRALQSPNLSTRYRAWEALQSMPGHGEAALRKLWKSKIEARMRARALFLLTQNHAQAQKYVQEALRDPDTDLRITGLRAAESARLEMIPFVKELLFDPSPQVRRECALALRHNQSPEAPQLWAELADQYDGHDRWYLEALGLGADRQDEAFFSAWLNSVTNQWNAPAGRGIIWRSRSPEACKFLADIIADQQTPREELPRYFRAFDFIRSGPEKMQALSHLLLDSEKLPEAQRETIAVESLKRLKDKNLAGNAAAEAMLKQVRAREQGTPAFVELVRDFKLTGQNAGLLEVALGHASDNSGAEALRLILASDDLSVLQSALRDTNLNVRLIEALGNTHDQKIVPLLLPFVTEPGLDTLARRQAVRSLSTIREGADQLLQLAQANQLPNDVKFIAAMELNRAPWPELKAKAAEILPLPQGRNGAPLPPVNELLKMTGNALNGARVFSRSQVGCVNCHRINQQGADVGPALTEIGTKLGKDALYEAILDPSASIEFGFENWHIEMKSGDEIYGIIVSDTADEIVVKDARAIATHLKKADIANRQKLKTSLMPAGLQQTMSTQDLVDLVEYLSSLKRAQASR
jgi:putative membrane-bound dehydrogenase-like protein